MASDIFKGTVENIKKSVKDYEASDLSKFTPKIQDIATDVLAELDESYNELYSLCVNDSQFLQKVVALINGMREKMEKYRLIFEKEKSSNYNNIIGKVDDLSENFFNYIGFWSQMHKDDKAIIDNDAAGIRLDLSNIVDKDDRKQKIESLNIKILKDLMIV